ncbi:hypothetical protein [Rickettsia endosymbiont of Seladonia tumulorum]
MPWLDHGIQKIIKNTNIISIFSWTPWTSHGVTIVEETHTNI